MYKRDRLALIPLLWMGRAAEMKLFSFTSEVYMLLGNNKYNPELSVNTDMAKMSLESRYCF